jgi:hypothetical protein
VASPKAHDAIREEILGEKASALGRAVRALEAAVAAWRAAPAPEALAEARERLWFVVIQREAMGLRRHEVLYEVLDVPDEVRRLMGPRRRAGAGRR